VVGLKKPSGNVEKEKKLRKGKKIDVSQNGSDTILNYQLSQKLKLIGICKFNHLTITLILLLKCGLKLTFNR
jgi:hypothetical protein